MTIETVLWVGLSILIVVCVVLSNYWIMDTYAKQVHIVVTGAYILRKLAYKKLKNYPCLNIYGMGHLPSLIRSNKVARPPPGLAVHGWVGNKFLGAIMGYHRKQYDKNKGKFRKIFNGEKDWSRQDKERIREYQDNGYERNNNGGIDERRKAG